MKRKVIILLVIFFVVIGVALYIVSLKNNYKTKLPFGLNDGKLMGIIQIGSGYEGYNDYDYSIVNKYFKTNNFENIELGGYEKYLIIPRDNTIDVYYLELTQDGDVEGKFVKSMNEPFYVTCNQSDIFSNCMLKITSINKQYSYSPYISLKDGSLVLEEFVINIDK